ncbi:hypothetical protein BUE80_DR001928 [Diplocarpon rosae]|nr:hypothetical protein BUE80_DR001928 [Diplocarpon rosae]
MSRTTPVHQGPNLLLRNYNTSGAILNDFNSRYNLDHSFGGIARLLLASNLPAPANHMGLGSIASDNQDIEMTTALSRRQSQIHGMQLGAAAASNSQARVCSCTRDSQLAKSPLPIQVTDAAFKVSRPYARLPVHDLLNGPTRPPGWGDHQHEPLQSAKQTPTISNNSRKDSDHLKTISRASSTRSVLSSISSDSTIRPPFSLAEERFFLLNTLYHTCMDATASYAASLLPASRHRHNQLPRHRHNQARFHPYAPLRGRRSRNSANNARPASLMDNISTISTHIWRKARCDDMAPHRAEADAVRGMRDLYAWSEVIARGLESKAIDDGRADGGGSEADEDAEDLGMRVGRAAKKLCQWLGDGQAWDECHGVTGELRDLSEREVPGGWISEIEDESDGSGDTC